MKGLKIWAGILLALAVLLYLLGMLSGEFNKGYGLLGWGNSPVALALLLGIAMLLLLCVSLLFVISALSQREAAEDTKTENRKE